MPTYLEDILVLVLVVFYLNFSTKNHPTIFRTGDGAMVIELDIHQVVYHHNTGVVVVAESRTCEIIPYALSYFVSRTPKPFEQHMLVRLIEISVLEVRQLCLTSDLT